MVEFLPVQLYIIHWVLFSIVAQKKNLKQNKAYIVKQLRWAALVSVQCSYLPHVEVPRCPGIVAIIANCSLHLGQICSNVSVFVSVGIRRALLLSAGKCFVGIAACVKQQVFVCGESVAKLWSICVFFDAEFHESFLVKDSSFWFWRCPH